MTATTELFTREGKPHSILTETDDGQIITQEWRYAVTGVTLVNVRLSEAALSTVDSTAIDALVAVWEAAVAKPGFRPDARGATADTARSFLAQTRGRGVLHATTAA